MTSHATFRATLGCPVQSCARAVHGVTWKECDCLSGDCWVNSCDLNVCVTSGEQKKEQYLRIPNEEPGIGIYTRHL